MHISDSKPNLNAQIYEEAAEWLVELRLGDLDAAARERLDSWFRESPRHIRAFLELSSIWEDGGDPDLNRAQSTEALIARARAVSNVLPLGRGGRGLAVERMTVEEIKLRESDNRRGGRPRFSWRPFLVAS